VSDILWATGMFLAGGALALVWLAMLWVHVRSLVHKEKRGPALLAGALLRLLLVAGGFYLVISVGGSWMYLLAALAGFVVIRFAVLMIIRRRERDPAPTKSRHAA